jgi:hypothetical protein
MSRIILKTTRNRPGLPAMQGKLKKAHRLKAGALRKEAVEKK